MQPVLRLSLGPLHKAASCGLFSWSFVSRDGAPGDKGNLNSRVVAIRRFGVAIRRP